MTVPQKIELTYSERRDALIDSIRKKEIVLSHSSFNRFCKTPKSFIDYKLEPRKPFSEETPSLRYGKILDVEVLTPSEFDEKFVLEYVDKPKSGHAVKFSKMVAEGVDPEIAVTVWKNEDAQQKLNEYGKYIEYLKNSEGKDIITATEKDKAKRQAKALNRNGASRWVLEQLTETQKHLKWEYGGFKWHGYEDGSNDVIQMDLKTVKDTKRRKWRYHVKDYGYHRQTWNYNIAAKNDYKAFFWVCIDPSDDIIVWEYPKNRLMQVREEMDYFIKKFKTCSFLNAWHQSHDFYAGRGRGGIHEFSGI